MSAGVLAAAMFEQTTYGVVVYDAESLAIVDANHAACAMLGYSRDELLTARLPDIQGELTPEMVGQRVAFVRKQGHASFDTRLLHRRGRALDVHVESSLVSREGRDLIVSLWFDTTPLRRSSRPEPSAGSPVALTTEHDADEEPSSSMRDLPGAAGLLRLAFEEQRALMDSTSVGIVLLRERRILRANRRICEMLGYRETELIGQSVRIWYEDDATYDRIGREHLPVLVRGETYHAEFPLVRKNGSRLPARASATALDVRDPSRGVVIILEDISTERDAQAALRVVQAEQEAIVEAATCGIALIIDSRIVRANQELYEITGWPRGELVGESTRVWWPDADEYAAHELEVEEQLTRGQTFRREVHMARHDGTRRWTRVTGRAVDASDPSKGSVWVVDDISAERAVLEELRKAKQLAENAARLKSDFVANMSHEIRTPMNAIIGMSHLALKTELNPRQRDYLEKIQTASRHLLGIINDILDFSKLEASQMQFEQVEFMVDSMLADVTSVVAERAAAKGLEFLIDIDPKLPGSLIGDPLRLGQIFINFATNAVKFTEQGEVTLRASLASQDDGELILRGEVRDTGIGLSEEQCTRLFQSFQQADTSVTRKYGGTGLGLAICKRLVDLMGGEIGVVSKLGEGSTFWFTVPLVRGAAVSLRRPYANDLRGKRLLVVDDSAGARSVLLAQLRRMSFEADAVASGAEGLEEVARADRAGRPYDAVLLDWQMPGMDGIATAQALRKLKLSAQPKLMLITAYGKEAVISNTSILGIQPVLAKPITASVLFDGLITCLGTPRDDDSEPPPSRVMAPPSEHKQFNARRALLVEDNELNQEVARALLSELGLAVVVADNGQAALDRLREERFDVVFMDMQMPGMDGLTATREIRSTLGLGSLPIIAMTANAMNSDRERCLQAGMNDHVAKPIDPATLSSVLQRWLPPRSLAQRGSAPPSTPRSRDLSEGIPEHIPGIDIGSGLRSVLGRRALYASLLRRFSTSHRDFSLRLDLALRDGDLPTAERYAHTLKGVARQLGARELGEQAARLELAIRRHEPQEQITALALEVKTSLAALLSALKRTMSAPASSKPVAIDSVELRRVRALLAQKLAEHDVDAVQILQQYAPALRAALGERYVGIADAIESFEFAAALDQLRDGSDSSRMTPR